MAALSSRSKRKKVKMKQKSFLSHIPLSLLFGPACSHSFEHWHSCFPLDEAFKLEVPAPGGIKDAAPRSSDLFFVRDEEERCCRPAIAKEHDIGNYCSSRGLPSSGNPAGSFSSSSVTDSSITSCSLSAKQEQQAKDVNDLLHFCSIVDVGRRRRPRPLGLRTDGEEGEGSRGAAGRERRALVASGEGFPPYVR